MVNVMSINMLSDVESLVPNIRVANEARTMLVDSKKKLKMMKNFMGDYIILNPFIRF